MPDPTTTQDDDHLISWALGYDGYRRLAATPADLERLLAGARGSYRASGAVPAWCGVDLLRGWAFLLVRADHQAGGGTLGAEWDVVLDAVRRHEDSRGRDVPPSPVASAASSAVPRAFSSAERQHADPAFLLAKQARWRDAHVAPVNDLVDVIRAEVAASRGVDVAEVSVPYVDPDSGGVLARVLLVLESPAGPAALGSGMLSPDNDDTTARNMWRAYRASGLPRSAGLHWNAVPWYVGDGHREANVGRADVALGQQYLRRLVQLLPHLRVVVALGRPAQRSVSGVAAHLADRGTTVLEVPHPSPRVVASTGGHNLVQLRESMETAAELSGLRSRSR